MYWPEEFEALDLANPSKPLLHMIWPPPAATLDALLLGTKARRRAAGVPGNADKHWREEVRRLERFARRRGFLKRLRWG